MKYRSTVKTITFLFIFAIAIFIFASCGQNETPIKDFSWEDNYTGISITEYKGNDKHIVVPEIINNKKVTSIGYTFNGNVVIKSIVLPSGCSYASLGNCENLKKITALSPDFTDILSSYPKSLETLIVPNVTEFTLSRSYGNSPIQNPEFKNLELSSVTKLEAYTKNVELIDEKLSVKIPDNLCYYTNSNGTLIVSSERITKEYSSTYLIPDEATYTYDEASGKYIVDLSQELSSDVAAEIYCTLFSRKVVEVNGKTYSMP